MLNGRLVFSAGNFIRSSGGSWVWGSGGSLVIKGWVDLNNDGKRDKGDFGGTLMTGSFLNAELFQRNGTAILEAGVVDQVNPQLAALLHLSASSFTEQLELSLGNVSAKSRRWMRGEVEDGYLREERSGQTVPEASSILMLGAGLVSFAAWSLRRISR
jgi:hypothetical protein